MKQEHLICVDDEHIVLQSLKQELKQDDFFKNMNIHVTDNAQEALLLIEEILNENGEIPVVISDQRMPVMTGNEFLGKVHQRLPDTLNILFTGFSDLEAVVTLVNESALYRFLSKPWDKTDLRMTVKEAFSAYRQNKTINEQNQKIEGLTHAMVTALESTNFYFDEDTGNHIRRIAKISEFIAIRAGCNQDFVKMLKMYSPLHDIGKIGIDKQILHKPSKLTPAEYRKIKDHVLIGHRIINSTAIDTMAKNIVLYHHEKWSGEGYLEGLRGTEIPIEARIVSIADVFDALINRRVYKPAFEFPEALEIIRGQKGISFDPDLVDLFLQGMSEFTDPENTYRTMQF